MTRPPTPTLALGALAALLLAACGEAAPPEIEPAPVPPPVDAPETTPAESETAAGPMAVAGSWITLASQPEVILTEEGRVITDADGRPLGYPLLGQPFPAVGATMVDGTAFDSASLEGRWTVVDVWGLWCGDCMADAPYVAALATAIAQDPDLDFLSIHTPPSAARADQAYGKYGSVAAYFDAVGYSYPTVVDPDASLRTALQIQWTPSYLLVAPDGTIQGFTTDLSIGEESVKDLLRDVDRLKRSYASE